MKKIAFVVLFLTASLSAFAQKFDYNVGFSYLLNNYEHGISRYIDNGQSVYPYQYSHTLHGVSLTPEVGLLVAQSPSVYHRLRIGIDVFKQMGEQQDNLSLFKEMLVYYQLEARFVNEGSLEAYAGCFPRRALSGTGYLGPVYDSEFEFLDPNLEGFLVKYSRGNKIRAELALDWQGMLGDAFSPLRRERFQALSDGSWRFAGDFSFGWTVSVSHYSKSPLCDNVVDYSLVNPRISWAPETWFDDCLLELGGIFSYQCDRAADPTPVFPMGLWSRQGLGKWKVAIDNRFYFGDDLMPFYGSSFEGIPYGRDLYRAAAGFHTLRDVPSWADWVTVSYRPKIAKWISLDLAVTMHLGQPNEALGTGVLRGSDQRIGLRVNLDAFRPHPRVPRKAPSIFNPRKNQKI